MDNVTLDDREHYAKFGIFVKINDQIYGITNLHVALNSEGIVNLKDLSNQTLQIGSFSDDILFPNTFDISLFKIRNELQPLCVHTVYDSKGTEKPCRLFDGIISELYGKHVFKCRPCGEDYLYQCTKESTPTEGVVASKKVHEENAEVLGRSKFLVRHQCKAFAVPGESGTAIAIDSQQDNTILIVGILCGVSNEIEDGVYTTCCFLPDAVHQIEITLKADVRICAFEKSQYLQYQKIQCGTTIFFKSPEYVHAVDFEISAQLITYMGLKQDAPTQVLPFVFKTTVRELRHKVFQMKYANNASIFPIDNPEQTIVLSLYACVQCLYENKLHLVEKFLKDGLRIYTKTSSEYRLRLICKVLTRATWYFIDKGELDKAELVFEEGLEFLLDHKDVLPAEYLSYHYYDFSRYFDKLGQTDKAVKMASECFVGFNSRFKRKNTRTSSDRVILAACLKATALLNCSETFERHGSAATAANITEAEETLEYIEPFIETASVVQKVEFYLAKCDLEYRKGNNLLALAAAENSLKLAKENGITEESTWSNYRIQSIRASYTK